MIGSFRNSPSSLEFRYRSNWQPVQNIERKADFYIIEDNGELIKEGYELLAPGATVAVKSSWLSRVIKSLRGYRQNSNKEIIKRLMDGFYDPWMLSAPGGTGQFEETPIYESLKNLNMDGVNFERFHHSHVAHVGIMGQGNKQRYSPSFFRTTEGFDTRHLINHVIRDAMQHLGLWVNPPPPKNVKEEIKEKYLEFIFKKYPELNDHKEFLLNKLYKSINNRRYLSNKKPEEL